MGRGGRGCRGNWKLDDETGPLPDGAFDPNSTAMSFDDLPASRQPQSGSPFATLIGACLGGEIRLKDLGQLISWNSWTIVANRQVNCLRLFVVRQTDCDFAAGSDRLPSVGQQVDQDLLDLVAARHRQRNLGQIFFHADAVLLQLTIQQVHRLIDDASKIGRLHLIRTIASHAQDRVGDLGRSIGCRQDFLKRFSPSRRIGVPQTHLGVVQNGH